MFATETMTYFERGWEGQHDLLSEKLNGEIDVPKQQGAKYVLTSWLETPSPVTPEKHAVHSQTESGATLQSSRVALRCDRASPRLLFLLPGFRCGLRTLWCPCLVVPQR